MPLWNRCGNSVPLPETRCMLSSITPTPGNRTMQWSKCWISGSVHLKKGLSNILLPRLLIQLRIMVDHLNQFIRGGVRNNDRYLLSS
ncbi:hypothetical protein KPLM21_390020 [Klebsiella pneumoniae]|nr:hypothetical protein KPLM21_390020 [Klebsiella pneumoniae]